MLIPIAIGISMTKLVSTDFYREIKNKNTSFALLVSIVRQHAMSYLNIIKYLQNPEGLRKQYQNAIKRNKTEKQTSLVFNTS